MNKIKRTERGWAGHLILGVRCNWRRNTLIQHSDGRGIVVSSVGALPRLDKNGYRIGWEPIGVDRWYETMIFIAHKEGIFIEADVTQQRSIGGFKWSVSREPDGKTDLEAEEMHEKSVDYVMEHFDEVWNS